LYFLNEVFVFVFLTDVIATHLYVYKTGESVNTKIVSESEVGFVCYYSSSVGWFYNTLKVR